MSNELEGNIVVIQDISSITAETVNNIFNGTYDPSSSSGISPEDLKWSRIYTQNINPISDTIIDNIFSTTNIIIINDPTPGHSGGSEN